MSQLFFDALEPLHDGSQSYYGALMVNTTDLDVRTSSPHLGTAPTQHVPARAILHDREDTSYSLRNKMRDEIVGNAGYNASMVPPPAQLLPPPLPKIVTIPLPPLSPHIPIQTHTLLTYCPHISPLFWAIPLPPSTARLAFTTADGNGGSWLYSVAIIPTTLPSITIRIGGIERPIVVFPAEAGHPIRIKDILQAVYSAARTAALEKNYVATGGSLTVNKLGTRTSRNSATEDAIAADAIRGYLRHRVWWNGLSKSMAEADVWILHLRGPTFPW